MIKKIIYGGRVIANNDPWMIGRVRIFPDDEVIQQILDSKKGEYDSQGVSILNDNQSDIRNVYQFTSKDPFVYLPLLPINLSILPEINEFNNMNISQLKEECKKRRINTSGKKKEELINLLN